MSHPMLRLTRSQVRTAGAVAAAACLALTAACGAGGTAAGKGKIVEDAGPPQDGGILHTAATADAPSLDIQKEASYMTHVAVGTVYSRLVAPKTGKDVEYGSSELEGDLAEKWSKSEDLKTWTFNLRQGVKFHDKPPVDGREFTSADVKCTVDRIKSLPGHQLGLVAGVTEVETPDPYTVVFTLGSANAAFDQTVANPFMAVLPCEGTKGEFNLAEEAIGTGPFVLKSWKRDQERVMEKNPDYFIEGLPHLDGIQTTVLPDAQAQIAALRSGKLDMISSLSTEKRQVDQLLSQIDGLQLRTEKGITQTRVFMNAQEGPFSKLEVRRAVAHAIDKEGMIKALRSGGSLTGPISPTLFGALPQDEVDGLLEYDPEKAKKLLADAGYPNGFSAELVATDGYGETILREAQWVQEDLSKIGIKLTIDQQDYATYVSSTWPETKYDIMYGLQTPMLTADEYLTSEYTSTGTRNWSKVDDPELDEMVAAQRVITDEAQREKALQDIERYIMENVSTPLPLYAYDTQTLYSGKVHDYYPHPDYSSRELQNVWMEQE
ncbi:ABC transporter substrate-binding protein [Nocardioides sp. NBC_00163]|uniref:ABC transporter substrate-binding protein n=1 Tax=Nocardioides sp. NBC_00163 TaxID=2975999 RepID=UPI003245FFCD